MKDNHERFIKYLRKHEIVDSGDTLKRWMKMIPITSKKIIETRWGIDGTSHCANYKQLNDKLGVNNGEELYFKAEQDLADSKYVELLIDYQELDNWKQAVNLGRLAKNIFVTCESSSIYGKRLLETLEILDEDEKNVIFLRYGLKDGGLRSLQQVGQSFCSYKENIRQIEHKAMEKLRGYTVAKNFYLKYIQNSIAADDINNLNLSNRTFLILKRAGYDSIKQLKELSTRDFLKIRYLGKKGLEEILEKMEKYSFETDM